MFYPFSGKKIGPIGWRDVLQLRLWTHRLAIGIRISGWYDKVRLAIGGTSGVQLGQRIEALMTARDIKNLNALAKLAGVSQGRLWEIVNKPNINPRIDTLERIANALGVTVEELRQGESADNEPEPMSWLWQARFAALRPTDVFEHRSWSIDHRCRWAIELLLDVMDLPGLAGRLGLPREHVADLAAGKAGGTPAILDLLVERCQLPIQWALNGDPGAINTELRAVLQHRDSGAYLKLIVKAMTAGISPELLDRQIDLLLAARKEAQ